MRDGTDYGNITRIYEDNDDTHRRVIETDYYGGKPNLEPTDDQKDLNQTIMPAEHVEPTSSIWEGILGLVEDLDRDSKMDVSKVIL